MDHVKHYADLRRVSKAWHETTNPVQRLTSRVDNQSVRDDVEARVATARNAIHEPIMGRVNKLNNRLKEEIGLLIREGTVTRNGFVAPNQTTRRKLH
jgi:hypothetical protein